MSNYFVTTAISYPNGAPHLGHAYEAILADVFARHQRLKGNDVVFSTGTDEHGLKIAKAAAQSGAPPQDYVDAATQPFIALAAALGLSEHVFVRTTSDRHKKTVAALFKNFDPNDFYLGAYAGHYSIRDEAFVPDDDLVDGPNGKTTRGGDPVEYVSEPCWFFRLTNYKTVLQAHFAANPDFVQPKSRFNETLKLLENLQDVAISRTKFTWGISVPDSPGHVFYVWVDALANYLTAIEYPDTSRWPADLHVIGKDILRFHAILWPALLLSAGLPLPKTILAHGFLKIEGERMSKSVGNGVDPIALVEEFGAERVRYYLLKAVALGEDGNFSRGDLITTCNADLSNALGNLAQRCLKFYRASYGNREQPCYRSHADDKELDSHVDALCRTVISALDNHDINAALRAIWDVVHRANVYFTEQAPWNKDLDDIRKRSVLAVTLGALAEIARSLQALLPDTAADLWRQLGDGPSDRYYCRRTHGLELPEPTPLFTRLVR